MTVMYKNFHIEMFETNKYHIVDTNGNMLCNNTGIVLEFNSIDEVKDYIDNYIM